MAELVNELDSMNAFDEFVKEGLVLVDFYAEWCMPCLMMHPVLDEMAEKFEGKIKFAKLNVEEAGDVAQKFGISSIPNLILFRDGQKIANFVGAQTAEDFEEKLSEFA